MTAPYSATPAPARSCSGRNGRHRGQSGSVLDVSWTVQSSPSVNVEQRSKRQTRSIPHPLISIVELDQAFALVAEIGAIRLHLERFSSTEKLPPDESAPH